MSSELNLQLIRAMEKAGCELTFHVSTEHPEYTLTVQHQGRRFSVACEGRFDFEGAYREWRSLEKVQPEPVPNVEPVKEAVERPRTKRKARTRVVTAPNAPAAPTRENPAPQTDGSDRLSLKERLKLRNQERGAA